MRRMEPRRSVRYDGAQSDTLVADPLMSLDSLSECSLRCVCVRVQQDCLGCGACQEELTKLQAAKEKDKLVDAKSKEISHSSVQL